MSVPGSHTATNAAPMDSLDDVLTNFAEEVANAWTDLEHDLVDQLFGRI